MCLECKNNIFTASDFVFWLLSVHFRLFGEVQEEILQYIIDIMCSFRYIYIYMAVGLEMAPSIKYLHPSMRTSVRITSILVKNLSW